MSRTDHIRRHPEDDADFLSGRTKGLVSTWECAMRTVLLGCGVAAGSQRLDCLPCLSNAKFGRGLENPGPLRGTLWRVLIGVVAYSGESLAEE